MLITHKDGELSLDLFSPSKVRLRWMKPATGSWVAVYLDREHTLRMASHLADLAEKMAPPEPVCSFCGKSAEAVRKLIAGPGSMICNECVALCSEIVDGGEKEGG